MVRTTTIEEGMEEEGREGVRMNEVNGSIPASQIIAIMLLRFVASLKWFTVFSLFLFCRAHYPEISLTA